MLHRFTYRLATLACGIAFFVILLGAYTRLTNAGLGCPDWPGCYGQLIVANKQLNSLQTSQAWTEMIHRYAAFLLGTCIVSLVGIALFRRRQFNQPLMIPVLLVCVLFFQAALGMWTVTLKLHPMVVMGHLLGGLTLLSLLWCLRLQNADVIPAKAGIQETRHNSWIPAFAGMTLLGLIILICQICLGVWVSANYAGLSCIGFPWCNGEVWPTMNWHSAFNLIRPIGVNYQGGILDTSARITIQMIHRIGALVTASYLVLLSGYLIYKVAIPSVHRAAMCVLLFCCLQLALGIINVTHLLPLSIAVMHNGAAALLLLSVVSVNYYLFYSQRRTT